MTQKKDYLIVHKNRYMWFVKMKRSQCSTHGGDQDDVTGGVISVLGECNSQENAAVSLNMQWPTILEQTYITFS